MVAPVTPAATRGERGRPRRKSIGAITDAPEPSPWNATKSAKTPPSNCSETTPTKPKLVDITQAIADHYSYLPLTRRDARDAPST